MQHPLIGKEFKVLDNGLIRVVDIMGDDSAVVQAARVSYGAGTKTVSSDRGLIRYLMRHHHTTPFEMCELKLHVRVPMDCWRQWIRHRSACLSGDTLLHFDSPGDSRRPKRRIYPRTIEHVFNCFQPSKNKTRSDKQRNPYYKRDRIRKMLLRCVNEHTFERTHTRIVDVWQSGVKDVWEVRFETFSIKVSEDHLFLTNQGWKKLSEVANLSKSGESRVKDGVYLQHLSSGKKCGFDHRPVPVTRKEQWRPIVDWEGYYEVSDIGNVRRVCGGRGSRSRGRNKALTVNCGRAVVSLNKPGVQETRLVHRLMMEAFVGPCPDNMEVCHNDGNGLNNSLSNLRYDTPLSNASDRVRDDCTTRLRANEVTPEIRYAGREMTYDLEVEGPWHNFSAGGFIVHNSVNEYSTRYSHAIDAAQTTRPDQWRAQSTTNKQGSAGYYLPEEVGRNLSAEEESLQRQIRNEYLLRLQAGVAREQARKDLPLSTYTEAYWKIDLHNLLHFLRLRMDSHAQQEIREYATIIGNEIVAQWCPLVWEAFLDYRVNSLTLSYYDLNVIKALVAGDKVAANEAAGGKSRERSELEAKLSRLGLSLD